MDQRSIPSGRLAFDVVQTGPNTYALYEKGTKIRANLHEKFLELEAQGCFASKK